MSRRTKYTAVEDETRYHEEDEEDDLNAKASDYDVLAALLVVGVLGLGKNPAAWFGGQIDVCGIAT